MNLNQTFRLGIDIGGTHIDLAAVDKDNNILAIYKKPVSYPIEDAILAAITGILSQGLDPSKCDRIHIGTTLAINSLLELKDLSKVGVIRIASHNPALPPAYNFPKEKRDAILVGHETIAGGFEYNKDSLGTFANKELNYAVDKLVAKGAESLVLIGVFSPLYPEEEEKAYQTILHSKHQKIPITLSHQVGGIGFIARENNAILNACLKKVIAEHFNNLQQKFESIKLAGAVYFTQNNGTLISIENALAFPIRTIASGPTNSLNGAAKLAQKTDAIIIDIGGTSTEIGVIENGFPRYSTEGANIGGIPTDYMLPNISIVALGGGSIIKKQSNFFTIGPNSVGAELYTKSLSYGGNTLTFFDIGNYFHKNYPENSEKFDLSYEEASAIMQNGVNILNNVIDQLTFDKEKTIILVGGGCSNIPSQYIQSNMIRPNFYEVANAYGAALAEISGTIDTIIDLSSDKEKAISDIEELAKAKAIMEGALDGSVRIIEKRLLPFYYMDKPLTRVIITAAGVC